MSQFLHIVAFASNMQGCLSQRTKLIDYTSLGKMALEKIIKVQRTRRSGYMPDHSVMKRFSFVLFKHLFKKFKSPQSFCSIRDPAMKLHCERVNAGIISPLCTLPARLSCKSFNHIIKAPNDHRTPKMLGFEAIKVQSAVALP